MPSKRELYAGVAFFSVAAAAIVAFRRPFDLTGWACLVACLGFVMLGGIAILKPHLAAGRRRHQTTAAGDLLATLERDLDRNEAPVGDPSATEREVLERTLSALEAVGALKPGEVHATMLWTARQRMDPGRPVGVHEALAAFPALQDLGRGQVGRLIFVPSHTEYDPLLIAEIVAAALVSLGHDIRPADIGVELPAGGGEGTATIAFPLADRIEQVTCHYRWKYPPDDLMPALARFARPDDPHDLVGADPGDQTLLYAAIRAGTLAELNRRLPGSQDLFDKVEPIATAFPKEYPRT